MTIRRATGLIGGQFTGESVRPQGYQYPVGLITKIAANEGIKA